MKFRDIFHKRASFWAASNYGFTFVELVVTIIVMAILTHTVIVNVGDLVQDTRIKNAVNIAMADIRIAQEMGMHFRRPVRFYVQSNLNRYYAQYADNSSAVLNAEGDPIDRTFNTGEFKGVTITDTETSNLLFSDIGRPSIGSNENRIVMELNRGKFTIYIFSSGLTTYEDDDGGGCGCGG